MFFVANLVIFCSTAASYSAWKFVHWRKETMTKDPSYQIHKVIQTGSEREALPTLFLEEVLGLCKDKPVSYYTFSTKKAEEKLLSTSVIQNVKVQKIKPDLVFIDYEKRRPVALIADFQNRAIDQTFVLFPFSPFYAAQKLPQIFLGISKFEGSLKELPSLHLALTILEEFYRLNKHRDLHLSWIDVSHTDHSSLGKREIVAIVTRGEMNHFLRLTTKRYREEIGNYLTICDKVTREGRKDYDRVVDFRISDLAFVEECERRA